MVFTALVTAGCGGGGSSTAGTANGGTTNDIPVVTDPTPVPQTTAVLQITQTNAPSKDVPANVVNERFTGFDASGNIVFGPVIKPKATSYEFVVPVTMVTLRIDYLDANGVVVQTGTTSVSLSGGQTTVVNSPTFNPPPTPTPAASPSPTANPSPSPSPSTAPTPNPLPTPTPTPVVQGVSGLVSDFSIPNVRGLSAFGQSGGVVFIPHAALAPFIPNIPDGEVAYIYTFPNANSLVEVFVTPDPVTGALSYTTGNPVVVTGNPTGVCYNPKPFPGAVARGDVPSANPQAIPDPPTVWVVCPNDNGGAGSVRGFTAVLGATGFQYGIPGAMTNPGAIAQQGGFAAGSVLKNITPLDDGSLLLTEYGVDNNPANGGNMTAILTAADPTVQFGGPGTGTPVQEDFKAKTPTVIESGPLTLATIGYRPWDAIEQSPGIAGVTLPGVGLVGHGSLAPDPFTFPTSGFPTEIASSSDGNFWFIDPVNSLIGFTNTNGNGDIYTVPAANATGGAGLRGISESLLGTPTLWFTEQNVNKVGVTGSTPDTGRGSFAEIRFQNVQLFPGVMSHQIDPALFQIANVLMGVCASPPVGSTVVLINPNQVLGEAAVYALTNVPNSIDPTAASGRLSPTGIAIGQDGKTYVCEFYSSQIDQIDTTKITQIAGPQASDVTAHFGLPNTAGTFTKAQMDAVLPSNGGNGAAVDTRPYAICTDASGNLWFTMQNANMIGRLTVSGANGATSTLTTIAIPTGQPAPGTTCRASGIARGPNNDIYFVEATGDGTTPKIGHITNLTAANPTITEINVPTAHSLPQNICLGPDGNMWFTEATGVTITTGTGTQNHPQIGKVDATTQAITEFGGPNAASKIAVNSNPFSIVSDGTNLWFTEVNGNAVGVITPSGTITEVNVGTDIGPNAITLGPDGNLWFTEIFAGQVAGLNPATKQFLNIKLQEVGPGSYGIVPLAPNAAFPKGAVLFTETNRDKLGVIAIQ
jgi:streptogramin lyase